MIQLPRRSVTRFFIPLIDVLTLLFCIFLLMPMVKPAAGSLTAGADPERLQQLERELEELRRQGQAPTPAMEEELKRLREEKLQALEQRLFIRVLEIDPDSGRLYINDPERIEIRGADDARELTDRDARALAGPGGQRREVYYLILYPRGGHSPFPLREQVEQYNGWFAGVAHGWDIPGTGPAGGGRR